MTNILPSLITALFGRGQSSSADPWAQRFLPAALTEARQDRGFNPQRDLCW